MWYTYIACNGRVCKMYAAKFLEFLSSIFGKQVKCLFNVYYWYLLIYASFTEKSLIIGKNVTVYYIIVRFIQRMFGCPILDLPFGWERGTDEDGTLIFIEWEFSLVLVNSFSKLFLFDNFLDTRGFLRNTLLKTWKFSDKDFFSKYMTKPVVSCRFVHTD